MLFERLGSLTSVGFYSVSDVRLTCGQSSSSCCVGTRVSKRILIPWDVRGIYNLLSLSGMLASI